MICLGAKLTSIFTITERHPELTTRISEFRLQSGAQKQPLIPNSKRPPLSLTP
ncbi:hypothetical protein M5D96_001651 [Drosophila gunungcola]|uniref:Uncharacterized protein n=1 Tax=Drosophila gunungcola TaxID=103775 RepID=A0A9Q0BVJ0_9MUSC|nr:hypothetical protein M5D96_001651 [Drosophila gunungcola]